MSLKRIEPALRFAAKEYAVTPDEIDRYELYTVVNPSADTAWYFIGTAGTAKVQPGTWLTVCPDYPRNNQFSITGSAAGMTGTAIINGKDQFGASVSETLALAAASNGGTTVGTQPFAQVTSGTFYYGTAIGNGTLRYGFATGGTTAMFGLPSKVGGTSDLLLYSFGSQSTAVKVGSGTLGAWINTSYHAILAPNDIVGSTTHLSVWYKPSYNGEGTQITGLTQV